MWWFNYQSHTWLLRGWGANQVPVFRQYGAMGYICLGWKLRSRTLQTEFWASRCGRIRLFSNKCGPNFHELFGLFDSQLFLYSEAQNIILCSNQFTILCFKIKSQFYMTYFSYLSFERKIFFLYLGSSVRGDCIRQKKFMSSSWSLFWLSATTTCSVESREQLHYVLVTNPGENEIQMIHEVESRNCSLTQPCPWAGMELHLQTWFRGTEAARSLQDWVVEGSLII